MTGKNKIISQTCRLRLDVQGYQNFSDEELNDFKFGIRFAYAVCSTLVALGLVFSNITLLIIAGAVAFWGMFPPYHPVDYLYNYIIRHIFRKPKLPPRTNQGRFACRIATVWIAVTIFFIYNGNILIGNILGVVLLIIAVLVSTTDICIPSMIYNALFKIKAKKVSGDSAVKP